MTDPVSLFSNGQLSLIPKDIIIEIIIAININKCSAEQLMFILLKWGQMQIEYHKTNGQREPLLKMMEILCLRSSCLPCCLNPTEHFAMEICCPIGIFYDIIKDLSPVAGHIFKKPEVQHKVLQAVSHYFSPKYSPMQQQFIKNPNKSNYDYCSVSSINSNLTRKLQLSHLICFHIQVKPKVLLFECIESNEFHSETTSVILDLLNKLNNKFILCSVPQLQESSNENFYEWQKFFFDQVESSAHCMVVLVTHSFLNFQEKLGNAKSIESPFHLCEQRILSVWSKFKQHSEESGSPILMVAMSQAVHERARIIFPQCLRAPNETKRLMRAIKNSTS